MKEEGEVVRFGEVEEGGEVGELGGGRGVVKPVII